MPPANRVGLQSFALIYPDDAARDRAVVHLRHIGASVVEENGAFITSDPSGNRVWLQV